MPPWNALSPRSGTGIGIYSDAAWYASLGRKEEMVDPGILEELIVLPVRRKLAMWARLTVLHWLKDRFGSVPPDIEHRVQEITKPDVLWQIESKAACCPDLETFRQALGG